MLKIIILISFISFNAEAISFEIEVLNHNTSEVKTFRPVNNKLFVLPSNLTEKGFLCISSSTFGDSKKITRGIVCKKESVSMGTNISCYKNQNISREAGLKLYDRDNENTHSIIISCK